MVTDSISGTMKMFGRKVKSDPVSNYLFNKLDRDGLINYEVAIAFRGGPRYAVAVDTVNDPDCPQLGDSTNFETSHRSVNSRLPSIHTRPKMITSIIIGDSRLSGLQYFVNRANTGTIPIQVLTCSGKGIQELTTIIENQTTNHPYARVILVGGICDCTQRNKDHRNISDKFIFNFDNSKDLTDHLYNLFKASSHDLSRNRPYVKVA